MKPGDTFTIAGVYEIIPNPAWRWWTFWRPRKIESDQLRVFIFPTYNAERHSSMHSGA